MDSSDVKNRFNKLMDFSVGRIAFTTFHQSYGYEEFLEGIKPVLDGDKKDVGYSIESGIFKKFYNNAAIRKVIPSSIEISNNASVWKATIRPEVKDDCSNNGRVRIDWGFNSDGTRGFVNDIKKSDILITTDRSRIIINGVAIVIEDDAYTLEGKLDTTARDVEWIAKDSELDIQKLNQEKILHRMICARVP